MPGPARPFLAVGAGFELLSLLPLIANIGFPFKHEHAVHGEQSDRRAAWRTCVIKEGQIKTIGCQFSPGRGGHEFLQGWFSVRMSA